MNRILSSNDLPFAAVFPATVGCCAFCDKLLLGKQMRWCSKVCSNNAWIHINALRGISKYLRILVFERDGGICASCHTAQSTANWQADHILEVAAGGSHELANVQTLCISCHKIKTKHFLQNRA